MAQKTEDDAIGYDYEWFGCDQDGHVGLFTTAGGSHAPLGLLRDTDAHAQAARVIVGGNVSMCKDVWGFVAERGLFAFDGEHGGGPYRRKGVPRVPRHIADLPPSVAAVSATVRLRNLRFAELEAITEDMLRQAETEPS